ncbi:MAG TPA: Rieske (2Fe-2S) protein [Chloroflexota bacterium]|nr:Rieske (2Fe-2S) protein [Chloroflexota bacterium]
MSDDSERPPENLGDYDALSAHVDDLLAGLPSSKRAPLPPAQPRLLRIAALLNSVSAPAAQPRPHFLRQLERQLQPSGARPSRFPRRQVLASFAALGLLVAGGIGDRALQLATRASSPPGWVPITTLRILTPGRVMRFVAQGMVGHVLNIGGQVWALSAVCTHQACLLDWQAQTRTFDCGCHGAAFNADGTQHPLPTYPRILPPLARLPVMVLQGRVLVQIVAPVAPPTPLPY